MEDTMDYLYFGEDFIGRFTGEQDDRNGFGLGIVSKSFKSLQPAGHGHVDIHDNEIRLGGPSKLDGHLTVISGHDDVAEFFQIGGHEVNEAGIVIDDEYFFVHGLPVMKSASRSAAAWWIFPVLAAVKRSRICPIRSGKRK